MTSKLIKNTSKHNKGENINNDLKDIHVKGGGIHVVILTGLYMLNREQLFFEIVMHLEK
jgi:hypothetical protein